MLCKKCKKECIESEIIDGFCLECYNKNHGDMSKLKSIKNEMAEYFKKWAVCTIIAGIIMGVLSMIASYGILTILTILLVSAVIGAILRAIAEIIQLLEDIKNK